MTTLTSLYSSFNSNGCETSREIAKRLLRFLAKNIVQTSKKKPHSETIT